MVEVKSRKKGFQQIMEILRKEITENMFAGEKIASQRELAKQFGVSQNIIHRVLSRLAQEGMVSRKKRLGTFVLPSGDNRNRTPEFFDLCLGLFHGSSREYLFQPNLTNILLRELHPIVEANKRHILYISHRTTGQLPDPDDIPWKILYALMVFNIWNKDMLREIARRGREKTVLIDADGREFGLHSVSFQNREAGAQLARILLTAGHRTFLAYDQKARKAEDIDPAYTERTEGFVTEVHRHSDTTVHIVDNWRRSERPRDYDARMDRVLAESGFTAVFMPGNTVYQAHKDYFQERGLKFPVDFSLTTVGASEFEEEPPGITRVVFSMADLGRAGMELAREIIESPPEGVINRLVAGQSVPGHSVAPPRERE